MNPPYFKKPLIRALCGLAAILFFDGAVQADATRSPGRNYLREAGTGVPWKAVRNPPTEAEQILYADVVRMIQMENQPLDAPNLLPQPGVEGHKPVLGLTTGFGTIDAPPLNLTDPPPPPSEGWETTVDGLKPFLLYQSQSASSPAASGFPTPVAPVAPGVPSPQQNESRSNEPSSSSAPLPWLKVPVRGGAAEAYVPVTYPFQQGLQTAPVSSSATYIQAPSYAQPYRQIVPLTGGTTQPPPPPQDDKGNNN